ncbi:MerR family transcriptional regulator [Pelistega sp. NLN82]|uniref:MerR family transcriptional regulator n=1 Tax=Pelistega ratti TaxID=2652177 RepID=A0A6L9Y588_9BURK|nr:MerR family transcriptional regulator [Pelistega ratti]NEN75426.1 MerR family transcriptional regulator [Pelistega ratti]
MNYRKNELIKLAEISPDTLRYYERIGLLSKPQRQTNGYRLFNDKHLNELRFIKTCRSLGFSIDDIRELQDLQSNSHANCHNADDIVAKHLANTTLKIQQLQQIQKTLQKIADCDQDKSADCKVLSFLIE